jgi:hypothetical protein
MTAEQIRQIDFKPGYSKPNDEPMFLMVQEIAAQLAELNERLRQAQGKHWSNTFHVTTHAEVGGDAR